MPVFTLDRISHPFLTEDPEQRYYRVDVLLPDWGDIAVSVDAYIGDFRKCLVSPPLAKRLGLDVGSDGFTGELVIQTEFEGDIVAHRSHPFPLKFGKARMGEAYLHLDLGMLENSFRTYEFDAIREGKRNLFFLVLRPRQTSEEPCITVPIEW